MTIVGTIAARDHAWIWTDSEVYRPDGRPHEMRPKMAANISARTVCVTAGWSGLGRIADEMVLGANELDDVVDAMPDHLRRYSAKAAGRWPIGMAQTFWCQTVLLAGFSRRTDRVLAYLFTGAAFFEPVLVTRFAQPAVDVFDHITPRRPTELLAGASRQMERLREQLPAANGGNLVVALVRPDGVSAGPVGELTPAHRGLPPATPIPPSYLEEHA